MALRARQISHSLAVSLLNSIPLLSLRLCGYSCGRRARSRSYEMKFEPIATGFCFLEAPREDRGYVWFTDVITGGLKRLSPDGRIDEFLQGRRWIGGIALN